MSTPVDKILQEQLAEIRNLNTETRKMIEETRKLRIEQVILPLASGSGAMAVAIGFAKLFL